MPCWHDLADLCFACRMSHFLSFALAILQQAGTISDSNLLQAPLAGHMLADMRCTKGRAIPTLHCDGGPSLCACCPYVRLQTDAMQSEDLGSAAGSARQHAGHIQHTYGSTRMHITRSLKAPPPQAIAPLHDCLRACGRSMLAQELQASLAWLVSNSAGHEGA